MDEQQLKTVRKLAQYFLDQLNFCDASAIRWETYGDKDATENWITRREVEVLLSLAAEHVKDAKPELEPTAWERAVQRTVDAILTRDEEQKPKQPAAK